eukprot:TRINITY_DN14964_c0_g1_i1.p1 TRINITY_DN14964_c0_g1~~TRINITY_DN14964_c0_g1_i1.p1  ORF type:complete len:502 (+),score=145.78 TRINITY_DN14964_c0_g1_i1:63-1568(+)
MPRVRKVLKGRAEPAAPVDPAVAQQLEYEAYLKEERDKKIRQEALRTMMKDRMELEEKLGRLNRLKIQDNWRRIMRETKLADLKKEIEVLSQTHEREIDRKDTLIAMLTRDLDEAEEQQQMAVRAHLQTVDELMDLQRSRINALQAEYDKGVADLVAEFSAERQQIIAQHNQERTELMEVMATMDREFAESESLARMHFTTTKDELNTKNSEDYGIMKGNLDGNIEELERHFENAHTQWMRQNDQRQEQFKMMMLRDDDTTNLIRKQQERIKNLQDSIAYWRAKLQNNVRECDERNHALKDEKEVVQRHFQALKGRMTRFRDAQHRRLTHLTVVADKCTKSLEQKLVKSEKILRLVEMNRKLETEREKVLPFYKSTVEDTDTFDDAELAQLKSWHARAVDKDGKPVEQWNHLERFYRRANKVELDKAALAREKEALQQENEDLRKILKQYLDGITINEDVLSTANPLLIVNKKSNTMWPEAQPVETRTVIEGAHVARVGRW